jgi:Uma2 family endonuclease
LGGGTTVDSLPETSNMDALVLDPRQSERLIAERHARGLNRFDEVWEGTYVMAPAPNDEHQSITTRLARPFLEVVEDAGIGVVRICINLAIDPDHWEDDYRVPDTTIFLSKSSAVCHGAFWSGPPDFVVEVVSPYDRTREKLNFYGRLKTRELLIVDRDPWQLELYRLQGNKMALTAKVSLGDTTSLASEVLPLQFRLIPGDPRPTIEVTSNSGQGWTI